MTVEEQQQQLPTTSTKLSTDVSGMAASMVQQFKPISNIMMHLNGIHGYADDPKRQIIVDHYCGHLTEDLRQCLIYDSSDEKTAKLIGVEYIISRRMFDNLPDEEKHFWHSHAHEVSSGLLVMPRIPNAMEKVEMRKLADTYGKTWHFWQVDRGDPLPYGEPKLMCSMTNDQMVDRTLLARRDAKFGIDADKLRSLRVEIQVPPPHPLADQFLKRGM